MPATGPWPRFGCLSMFRVIAIALLLFAGTARAQVTRAVTVYNGNTSLGLVGKLKFSSGVCSSTGASTVTCTITATSLGNFTFSGNVADLTSSGTMTLGSTNTTAIHFAGSGATSFDGAAAVIDFSGSGPTFGAQGGYPVVLGGGAAIAVNLTKPARLSGGGLALTRTTQANTTYSPGLDGNNYPAQTIVWMSNVAARTVTLPTAASYLNGAMLLLVDSAGTGLTANVSVAKSGSDTINGGSGNVAVVTLGFAHSTCISDGSAAWICGVNN